MKKFLQTISFFILLYSLVLCGGLVFAENLSVIDKCSSDKIDLNLKYDTLTQEPIEKLCLSGAEYKTLKSDIKKSRIDNLKTKGYDFDIKDREKVYAIMDYEVRQKGGLSIKGATKEKIKTELLKLLD
jgi:hypothetical protein